MQVSATAARNVASQTAEMPPGQSTNGIVILWQAIANCTKLTSIPQDQIDCADAAFSLGCHDVARLLYDVALIRLGFTPFAVSSWRSTAERTGLWTDRELAAPDIRTSGMFAVDVALAQLRALMTMEQELPPLIAAELGAAGTVGVDELPSLPTTSPQGPELDARGVARLVGRLADALRRNDIDTLTVALDEMRSELLKPSRSYLAAHAIESMLEVAAIGALHQMRHFFQLHHHLCWAPFGSAKLFAATSRLQDAALGPYFSGVGRLLRVPNDVFGLVDLADTGEEAGRTVRLQRWLVLLSTHVDHDTRVRLTDEIGDRGLVLALAGMLPMIDRTPGSESQVLFTVRDAALDNGDLILAAKAQIAITGLDITDPREWIVLAEILATGGSIEAARMALCKALRLSPQHRGALDRLEALESGGFATFFTLAGFGSPPWRVALRARNRSKAEGAGAAIN